MQPLEDRLLDKVRQIEGRRDGYYAYDELEKCASFIESTFKDAGFVVENDFFDFGGKTYRNVIATKSGLKKREDWILVGAHYDAVPESPGADDNASGVAVMLETAKTTGPMERLKFVAFSLEEPQPSGTTFLLGSKHFVKKMKSAGYGYSAVFNLESVGYTSNLKGSQRAPFFVRAPDKGDFIALVSDSKSSFLSDKFEKNAKSAAPGLKTFKCSVPLRGYILPESRFSDHAPFWDAGYPAIMITDTAMMRNPNYHTPYDKVETLSSGFMADITLALENTILDLLGS